ncbi:MAG: hypothetical protein RLZZ67_268 [Candidatus Parcubacteria bacterium]|jgi:hypothetical protein
MNTALKIILGVLIVAAAFLGFKIYQKQSLSSVSAPVKAPVKAPVTAPVSKPVPVDPTKKLSEADKVEAKALLNSPKPDATEAEKQAFVQRVYSSAVDTKTVNISSCTAKPTVSGVINDSDISFVNDDTVEHSIVFNADKIFKIPANSSKIIKATFGMGVGIYGFGCDGSSGPAGMVVVK